MEVWAELTTDVVQFLVLYNEVLADKVATSVKNLIPVTLCFMIDHRRVMFCDVMEVFGQEFAS